MARAKRTDRAEARRRYRATLDESPFADDDASAAAAEDASAAEPTTAPAGPSGRERVRAASTRPTPPARPGMRAAFSQAFRPVDVRGDLAALPSLIRHRSFLLPLLLIVGAAVVYVLSKGTETEVFGVTLYAYFIAAPPIGPVFLAGFLAPRASWLLGVILGAISTVVLILISVAGGEIQKVIAETSGAGSALIVAVASSLTIAVVGGALFASVAAWYKRFLFLANPARAQRAAANRPGNQQRKRNSESRPALARRR